MNALIGAFIVAVLICYLLMAPLAFGHGSGSELYRGLGAAVLFGLAFSTLVILVFTPALFALVSRRAKFGEEATP